MSIDINGLTKNALVTVRQLVPDAIVEGQLIKYGTTMDTATLKSSKSIAEQKTVECIFEDSTLEDESAQNSQVNTQEIHIIGFDVGDVREFDELVVGGETYKTVELEEIRIGLNVPLRTFVVSR
ncbi:MAG: hypothetical protein LC687_05450 [Actinobacteria bacterium]|nr:hypothetical protein [Actinomycetota bacterium]MCA1807276.1 hypothetical protein [Actinomycetota bacterium]